VRCLELERACWSPGGVDPQGTPDRNAISNGSSDISEGVLPLTTCCANVRWLIYRIITGGKLMCTPTQFWMRGSPPRTEVSSLIDALDARQESKVVAALTNVNERVMAKASNLLTFNGVLAALYALSQPVPSTFLQKSPVLLAFMSCGLLFVVIFPVWYKNVSVDASVEAHRLGHLCRIRCNFLVWALLLAAAAGVAS
jgi:hypothetical protein